MRVVFFDQPFIPTRTHGSSRTYQLAKRLMARGHEVRIVTSSAHFPPEYQTESGPTLIEGIPLIVLNVPYGNEMPFSQRIKAFLKFALLACREATRQKADVFFAGSPPLTIAVPAIVAKLWQRKPLVFEVRDLWPELPIAVGALKNPVLRWLAKILEWVAYHASDHVMALSPGMAEGVIRRGISPERVTVTYNGGDLDVFDVPAECGQPVRDRLGLKDGQPLVVYAGTFGLVNHLSWLLEVARTMLDIAPDVHFLLVGTGAERPKIIELARELGVLDRNLTIWEPLSKLDMPPVLAASTISVSTVLPLKELWHNSANKFFDALAAGKPQAINHEGWQADVLRETGAGIVMPADDTHQAALDLAAFIHDPRGWNRPRSPLASWHARDTTVV
jgi:glycosyltransferase involved in cell wall biosynthesis